ncbi:glutamyl-tRNA reductase [soil metagenome]
MSIQLVGLNHRTAPVELREQLAFSREGVSTALLLLRNQFPKCEAAILSTCNRVEILTASDGDKPTLNDIVSFLAQAKDLPIQAFRHYLYELSDEQATRHFFRVAGGLDSMVLGECQIVSQVKQSYALASEQGTTGRVLNRLFHHAFEVGKRLRTETSISEGKTSLPSVAVDVARQIFSDFSNKQTLVVGAGDMAQLVCQYLREANATRFVVTSRTLSNARAIAEACQGEAVPFDQLDEQLVLADIAIMATSCPKPILTVERVREIQKRRHGRMLFLIDLAVPRNVEPAVAEIDQVYVYDMDALGRIVAENNQQRQAQLQVCEQILDEEVSLFEKWICETKINPMIAQVYSDARELRDAELNRLFRKCPDLLEDDKREIIQAVDRLVGKFMHPCIATMRQHSYSTPPVTLARAFHAVAELLDRR